MEVVAMALKQEVLSSTFEYTGNNAVGKLNTLRLDFKCPCAWYDQHYQL